MAASAMKIINGQRNGRSAAQWAKLIDDAWTKTLDSVFETGDALLGAKEQLKHGEWIKMVERELPFGRMTAHRLMQIAEDDRLRDVTRVLHLPASWGTLYALHRLPGDVIDKSFENGTIHPKLERKDVKFLPDAPHHLARQAKKETPAPSKNVPPVEGCVMFVRRTVFEAIQTMTPEDKQALFAELRAELDDLEMKNR